MAPFFEGPSRPAYRASDSRRAPLDAYGGNDVTSFLAAHHTPFVYALPYPIKPQVHTKLPSWMTACTCASARLHIRNLMHILGLRRSLVNSPYGAKRGVSAMVTNGKEPENPSNLFGGCNFRKGKYLAFAGSLIRNAEFSGADWSVDLDLIDKQMARPFLWPNCVQKKHQMRYNERQRTGTNGKCLKILGGCNHIKGKDLSFCPDGDS
jgi:hypothetical protein